MAQLKENKRIGLIIILLFALLLVLNFLTPLTADDFAHLLSWEDGTKLQGLGDIIQSLKAMREVQNGRVFAHFFSMVFLMLPKPIFNIINALISAGLFSLIFRYIKSGDEKRDAWMLGFLIAFVWLLMPAFGQVMLWLTGACNYLWTIFISLLFIYPFYRQFMGQSGERGGKLRLALSCLFAFIAGAYSENGAFSMLGIAFCFMLLIVLRDRKIPKGLLLPFIVACAGFLFLMLAPSELGVKNAQGESGPLQRVLDLLSGLPLLYLVLAALLLLLLGAFFIWALLRHRRIACTVAALATGLVTVLAVLLLAPELSGLGFYQGAQRLLSDTKLSLVLMFGSYCLLLFIALGRGADARRILVSLVFFVGAVASLVVFAFAIYFPARSACPATFYTAIGSVILLSELWGGGWKKPVSICSGLVMAVFACVLVLSAMDIVYTQRQSLQREEIIAQAQESGQQQILLETIHAAGKYSVCWPREYANFNTGMASYYKVPEVWILDIDYA